MTKCISRYGKILLMTDQDADGSHIKGLMINMLHHFWPALLKHDGFLHEFVTPLVKVTPNALPTLPLPPMLPV